MRRLTRTVPRKFLRLLLLAFAVSSLFLFVWLLFSENNLVAKHNRDNMSESDSAPHENKDDTHKDKGAEQLIKEGDKRDSVATTVSEAYPPPNYDLHLFYYPWYGNPRFDKQYYHWNHQILLHWNKNEALKWPKGQYVPPDEVGAQYYPSLGAYSSQDPEVLKSHMQQTRMAGSGVLSVSWYPPGDHDEQGQDWNFLIPKIFDQAAAYQIKVCFHVEPFKGRTPQTVRSAVQHAIETYGNHPAMYKRLHRGKLLPLFYIYDSYLIKSEDWKALLQPDGKSTVRGTELDAIFIGLLLEDKDKFELKSAGFDGFYTYFAADGFTFGSTATHWKSLGAFARVNDLIFIPCVGPGYIDERIRPWNHKNTRDREGGTYYDTHFRAAIDADVDVIAVTSFNEWHEGTQIEMAVPKKTPEYKYLDYAPNPPDYYLSLTRTWSHKFLTLKKRKS